jgi:hypothetical protein
MQLLESEQLVLENEQLGARDGRWRSLVDFPREHTPTFSIALAD